MNGIYFGKKAKMFHSLHFALLSVHRSVVSGQSRSHYSTVLLTWASTACELLAKRRDGINAVFAKAQSLSHASHVKSLSRHNAFLTGWPLLPQSGHWAAQNRTLSAAICNSWFSAPFFPLLSLILLDFLQKNSLFKQRICAGSEMAGSSTDLLWQSLI